MPYYTDQLGWDDCGTMLFVAACHTHNDTVSPIVEKEWDVMEHPMVVRFEEDQEPDKLNKLAWQADEETILNWIETEGYSVDGPVEQNGKYSKADLSEYPRYGTEALEQFAFSTLCKVMQFEEKQLVPVVLDDSGEFLWDMM